MSDVAVLSMIAISSAHIRAMLIIIANDIVYIQFLCSKASKIIRAMITVQSRDATCRVNVIIIIYEA